MISTAVVKNLDDPLLDTNGDFGFNKHKRYQKEESSAIVSVVLESLEDSNVDELFDSGSGCYKFCRAPLRCPLASR